MIVAQDELRWNTITEMRKKLGVMPFLFFTFAVIVTQTYIEKEKEQRK